MDESCDCDVCKLARVLNCEDDPEAAEKQRKLAMDLAQKVSELFSKKTGVGDVRVVLLALCLLSAHGMKHLASDMKVPLELMAGAWVSLLEQALGNMSGMGTIQATSVH